MKRFAQLIRELDETTKTHRKVESLTSYFKDATPDDAHWALRFLCGKRPKPSRDDSATADLVCRRGRDSAMDV